MKFKSGFGLMEVLAAAVVLGFLIVGLTQLQKGNREAILRVRARDAANFVAQHVLDSISATGMKAITKNTMKCGNPNQHVVYCDPNYVYYFEGKPQVNKKTDGIKTKTEYNVEVSILESDETIKTSRDTTYFTTAINKNKTDTVSRSLEAVVSWKYKGAPQSIRMAKVVR